MSVCLACRLEYAMTGRMRCYVCADTTNETKETK